MAGIYGIVSPESWPQKNVFEDFYSFGKEGIINEEFYENGFTYGRSTLSSFSKDRFIHKKNQLIIGIEGFCYSVKENLSEWVFEQYNKRGNSFVEEMEGQFCGFVYDKKNHQLHIFTDHLSTKPLYSFISKDLELVFFSSELKAISKSLRRAGITISPDPDGIRCLLSCGYMLDNLTPIKEIRKLPYGTITTVHLDSFEVDEQQYFKIKKDQREGSKRDFIQGIDERIQKAVKLEWNKDSDYSSEHFTLLSGGLDSRVNAMMGASFTKKRIHSLTFSKPGTPDEKIAKKIAEDLGFNHHFISMDEGEYLIGSEYDFVKANDGLVGYYGAAHQQHSLEQLNLNRKGLLHTGQIGDVLFGSFTQKESGIENSFNKLFFYADERILSKIDVLQEMKLKEFDGADLEVFSLEHRQINGTMNGDRCSAHIADSASPFYNKELLKYCLSIPDRFKYNEAIYLEWINTCQPHLANYKWAATETKPSTSPIHKVLAFKNRALNYLARKVSSDKKNMNPFQDWYDRNPNYSKSLERVYKSRDLEGLEKELRDDISYCYEKKSVISKMLAITAILSYRLHFLD